VVCKVNFKKIAKIIIRQLLLYPAALCSFTKNTEMKKAITFDNYFGMLYILTFAVIEHV
jgi:hypothetical protein